MSLNHNYVIMNRFELPWKQVSPAGFRGLDYHITPELTIRLEEIVSTTVKVSESGQPLSEVMENELEVAEEIFITYDEGHFAGLSGLNAEQMFNSEILSQKSKTRIEKSFKSKHEGLSCFFTEGQMKHFEALFNSNFYICNKVTVLHGTREIENIADLDKPAFKKVLNAFSELGVQATVNYKQSREELNEMYERYYAENIAKEDRFNKESKWDKVKNKGFRKKLIKTGIAILISGTSFILKNKYKKSDNILVSVGVIGLTILEFSSRQYSKNMAQRIINIF